MITNERQYKITRKQKKKFQDAIEHHNFKEAKQRLGSDVFAKAELDGLKSELEILADQLSEYEALQSGVIKKFTATNLQEVPEILIRSRIAQRLTQKELSDILGLQEQQIQRYEASNYSGASITRLSEIAEALNLNISNIFEIPTQKFLYKSQSHKELDWGAFPVREMYKRGWFKEFKGTLTAALDPANRVVEKFVRGVNQSPAHAFYRRYIRTGTTPNDYSLFAWECRVLSIAKKQEKKGEFNSKLLTQEWIEELIQYSSEPDSIIKVIELLSEVGITLVIEPHLSGTCLDGAVFIYDDSPVIGLTLRYDRLDNFWFVLLHEIGHVIKHLRKGQIDRIFDNLDEESRDQIEIEADQFAQESLIPSRIWDQAICRFVQTEELVNLFADEHCIHHSIVAGRIRYESNNYTILNNLIGQGDIRKCFPDVNFG